MRKSILFLSILALTVLALTGCGNQGSGLGVGNVVKTVDLAQTAQSIAQDSLDKNTVSSDENVNNIIKMMNYQGLSPEDNQKMKEAIKKGMEDGKTQSDMDKSLITDSAKNSNSLGTGYMLGYTFGCKAATGNETQCDKDIGKKYQEIFLEAFQNMASSSGSQTLPTSSTPAASGSLNLNP